MPCSTEGNRRSDVALDASQTSVVYPPTGSRPKEERRAPRLHAMLGMAHFTLLKKHTVLRLAVLVV